MIRELKTRSCRLKTRLCRALRALDRHHALIAAAHGVAATLVLLEAGVWAVLPDVVVGAIHLHLALRGKN